MQRKYPQTVAVSTTVINFDIGFCPIKAYIDKELLTR